MNRLLFGLIQWGAVPSTHDEPPQPSLYRLWTATMDGVSDHLLGQAADHIHHLYGAVKPERQVPPPVDRPPAYWRHRPDCPLRTLLQPDAHSPGEAIRRAGGLPARPPCMCGAEPMPSVLHAHARNQQ